MVVRHLELTELLCFLSGEENLREVVAFPMNQQAEDLMQSPSKISEKHLKELGLNLKKLKRLLDFCSLKITCFLTFGSYFFISSFSVIDFGFLNLT